MLQCDVVKVVGNTIYIAYIARAAIDRPLSLEKPLYKCNALANPITGSCAVRSLASTDYL